MLLLLDYFLEGVHIFVIFFNLLGWIARSTRLLHRICLGLTTLSWFGLGMFYGIGYCPITHWHWNIKMELGVTNLPNSYIKYIADKLLGSDLPAAVVDGVTLAVYLLIVVITTLVWVKERKASEQK